jgi:hypothetical protein
MTQLKTSADPVRTWLHRMRRLVTLAPRSEGDSTSRWEPDHHDATQMEFEFLVPAPAIAGRLPMSRGA